MRTRKDVKLPDFMKDPQYPPRQKEPPEIYTVFVKESLLERVADIFATAALLIAWWIVMVLATA